MCLCVEVTGLVRGNEKLGGGFFNEFLSNYNAKCYGGRTTTSTACRREECVASVLRCAHDNTGIIRSRCKYTFQYSKHTRRKMCRPQPSGELQQTSSLAQSAKKSQNNFFLHIFLFIIKLSTLTRQICGVLARPTSPSTNLSDQRFLLFRDGDQVGRAGERL